MTRRGDDRETSGATDFDAALEAYTFGGDAEALLRAAGNAGLHHSARSRDLVPELVPERTGQGGTKQVRPALGGGRTSKVKLLLAAETLYHLPFIGR
jgi:hypothetical protein